MYSDTPCPEFLRQFMTYQRVILMKSEKTLENYFSDLQIFMRFLLRERGRVPKDTPYEDIEIINTTIEDIRSLNKLTGLAYLNYLATVRKINARSRKRKLASLRTFYKCLNKDLELIDINPVKDLDYPKLPMNIPKYLTLNESRELLSSVGERHYLRDYCMVTLFVNCGMRLSELTGLDLTSINLDMRTMRLRGKGDKERMVHINDACAFAIDDYLKVRIPPDVNPMSVIDPNALFLSGQYRRISGRRVEQIVTEALDNAGLDSSKISVHKLRHTAATLMYQYGGADALILKEILGHKSVSTTEIYTHIAPEQIAKTMDNNPLANIKTPKKTEHSTDKPTVRKTAKNTEHSAVKPTARKTPKKTEHSTDKPTARKTAKKTESNIDKPTTRKTAKKPGGK
jgi:site-specific recombinase XerD